MNERDTVQRFIEQRWSPYLLAVLRIITGLLFLSHGIVKVLGFPEGAGSGQVPLVSLFGIAAFLELVGGSATILGLFTRPVAFVLAGQMAVAYFWMHLPASFFPLLNHGEAAILFCFIFLYLAAAGPGAMSIDAVRSKIAAPTDGHV